MNWPTIYAENMQVGIRLLSAGCVRSMWLRMVDFHQYCTVGFCSHEKRLSTHHEIRSYGSHRKHTAVRSLIQQVVDSDNDCAYNSNTFPHMQHTYAYGRAHRRERQMRNSLTQNSYVSYKHCRSMEFGAPSPLNLTYLFDEKQRQRYASHTAERENRS